MHFHNQDIKKDRTICQSDGPTLEPNDYVRVSFSLLEVRNHKEEAHQEKHL